MKPKTKRWGRKLLSGLTALSLSAAMVALPVAPSLTVKAGTVANLLTGKWAAIALEYIERGTMRAIGSAAAHAESEMVADILTTTKKLLGSPMSNTLTDIKKMCTQMNAKLDNIMKMMGTNQSILEAKLDAVTEANLRTNYEAKKRQLNDISEDYTYVIGLFQKFNQAVQKADVNDKQSMDDLRIAYESLSTIYESANGITTHTKVTFNFANDAQTIASLISSYPYSQVDYSYDVGDKNGWNLGNNNTGGDSSTLITDYYQMISYSDAFDHEIYRDMSALYSYVAGVVSTYLEAYNMYISFATQLIYAGETEEAISDRDKQKTVDSLWTDYNYYCYMVTRALAQMVDKYDSKLSGVMREYDINTTIHFDNVRETLTAGGIYVQGSMNDAKESKRNKTSSRMQAYQMRPFGSTTAYALRKTNSSQPAITMDDLAYYAFDIRVETFPFYQNDCDGPTCDYKNLVDSAATSPTGWNPLSSNSQLNGLVNTTAFEKVINNSNPSYITNYLKAHGMTKDLPKMDGDNKWTLSNQYDWDFHSGYIGNWDIDMHFYQINTLKKGSSMGTDVFDMEKVPSERQGKEVSVFYTGEPQVAVYLPSNGGAKYQYSAIDYKGKNASANGGRNVLKSGGTITLRIKPDEGKYIKSLRLCDRFVYDENHSKGTLTQYISEQDALYKSDCGIYPESDGYYTFHINVPFRDGSVILELADVPSKVHEVTLNESESVVGMQYADQDGGILTFSSFTGETIQKVNTGDQVTVAVMPYTGYICEGIKVTDSSGNVYTYQEVGQDDFYSILHEQKDFTFTMPDADVAVEAVYKEAFNVELISRAEYPNTTLKFMNDNGLADEKDTIRSFEAGEVVKIEAKAINGDMLTKVVVSDYTNREYIRCDINGDIVSFIMPEGNVQVEAESEKMVMSEYVASVKEECKDWVTLIDSDNNPLNILSVQAAPGETVRFAKGAIFSSVNCKAVGTSGTPVTVEKESDIICYLTMPNESVTISLDFTPHTLTIDEASYDLGLRFANKTGITLDPATVVWAEGSVIWLKSPLKCKQDLKATTASGQDVQVIKQSDELYGLVVPAEDTTITVTIYPRTVTLQTEDETGSIALLNEDGTVSEESSMTLYEGQTVLLKDTFKYKQDLSATTAGGEDVPIVKQSDDIYALTIPGDDVIIHATVYPHTVEEDLKAQNYHIVLIDDNGVEQPNPYMVGYEGQKIMIQVDPQLAADDHTLKVKDGNGNEIPLTTEGTDLYSFTVTSYTVISISADRYTMRIGNVEGGTASFDRDSSVMETRGEGNGWITAYLTAPKNNCLTNFSINFTSSGKPTDYSVQVKSTEQTDSGVLITVSCHVPLGDSTVNFTLGEGYTVYVDESGFAYGRDNEPIAYMQLKDYTTNSTHSGPAVMYPVTSTVEGFFFYDEFHYPAHLQIVGNETGTVYTNMDVQPDATSFFCHTSDFNPYGEDLTVKATFGEIEHPDPDAVTVSLDTEKFVYDENGTPTSYLTFESTGTSDPLVIKKDTEFTISYTEDDDHTLTGLTVMKASGTSEEITFANGTVTYQADDSMLLVPVFEEKAEPIPEPEPAQVTISTYEELVAFAENVQNDYAHYGKASVQLATNIIAPDDSTWTTAIGSAEQPFNGTFDGSGFAVVGLKISISDNGGLFGVIGTQGVVKDMAVIQSSFKTQSQTAGGIAAVNNGLIDHCVSGINTDVGGRGVSIRKYGSDVYGTVSGGIAGVNGGTITGCRSSAFVVGGDAAGIAAINNGTIYGCANNGAIGSNSVINQRVGGLTVENNGTIKSCYNSGKENGSSKTVMAAVSVTNSGSIQDVFYSTLGGTVAAMGPEADMTQVSMTEKTIEEMQAATFSDELNNVTDSSVTWRQISYRKTRMNQGFPIVAGRFIQQVTISDDLKLKVKALILKAMKVNYVPMMLRSSTYTAMQSAAGTRTLTSAYDATAADPSGNDLPAELWCEGVTVSVPVSTNDAQIIVINSDGETDVFAPDSIENGWATFTMAEPMAFAVAENVTSDEPSPTPVIPDDGNVKTGESTLPLTAACAAVLISVCAVLWARRKKERE